MSRRRFERLPRERQDEILDAAAAEFARSGYHRTSYNQLLDRLQIGKSSAYTYFEGKRDLFLAALERCYERFYTAFEELDRPATPDEFWSFVELATRVGYARMLEDPTAAHMMQCMQRERVLLDELGASELLAGVDAYYDEVVREGQRLGAVRTDVPQDLLVETLREIGTTLDRWFITHHECSKPAATPERAARLFTDLARRIGAPPARARAG